MLKTILLTLFVLFLSTYYSLSQNERYWIGGSSTQWNDPANWTEFSGDPTDNILPDINSEVHFDDLSGTGVIIVNSNISISKLFFTANCSNVTLELTTGIFSIVNTLSMSTGLETLSINGGTLSVAGTSTISGGTLNVLNGILNSPIANINVSSSSIVNFTNGTINLGGSFNISGGTVNLNGATLTVNIILEISLTGILNTSSGTLNLFGTGEVLHLVSGGKMNQSGATIYIGDGIDESVFVELGNLNISSGTMYVKHYYNNADGSSIISGGLLYVGTSINISATPFRFYGTSTISGGTIIIDHVSSTGTGLAVDIDNSITNTGGLIKINAANYNYRIRPRKCFNLEINSPGVIASLNVSSTIYGNLTVNDGTLTYTSTQTLSFLGTVPQTISGTNPTQIKIYNLTLNNPSGLSIAPSNNISTFIYNTLNLTSGKITLDNYNLCIGFTGISGSITNASSSNYIITNGTGVLKQYNIGTGQRTSALFPIGINSTSYTPVTIAVSGSSTVDNFSVRVSDNMLKLGTSGLLFTSYKVDKTWHISEETPTGSNVTITPFWNLSNELTSFSRSISEVKHFNSVWTSENGSAWSGPTNGLYSVTSDPVSSFSPFGVGSPLLLPIELTDFSAVIENRNVHLSWKTETELNNDHFEIFRSFDGTNFDNIQQINGSGNSSQTINYSFIDKNIPVGITYYKLNQIDFNGESTISDIIAVNMNSNNEYNLTFPNPSNGEIININLEKDFQDMELVISIVDDKGNVVFINIVNPTNPILTINLNKELQKGIYNLNIKSKEKEINKKITII